MKTQTPNSTHRQIPHFDGPFNARTVARLCWLGLLAGLCLRLATANAENYITDGNFDNLQVGSAPDNNEDAGAWHIEHIPSLPNVIEDEPHQFSIVPTSSFVPGASGKSLRINMPSSLPDHTWLRSNLDDPILEEENQMVRASFDVFVPDSGNSEQGGFGLTIGEDTGGSRRGVQLTWNSDGSIHTSSGHGSTEIPQTYTERVFETPLDKWQHVQLDIDLAADRYDFFWSAEGTPLDLVASYVGFIAPRDALGVVGIAMWTDHRPRPVGEAFLDNFNIEVLERTPGDTNYDGEIDTADFRAMAKNFGVNPAAWSQGDFDRNGTVGLSDVMLLSEIISNSDKAELAGLFEAPQTTSLSVGQTYTQDFNSLSMDGTAGSHLPAAWSVTGQDGAVHKTETNYDFPPGISLRSETSAFFALSAGAPEGEQTGDRTLAVYKPNGGQDDPVAIQLLADTEGAASAVHVEFSIEAWDRLRRNGIGDEAKFDVSIEIDTGEGSEFSNITGGDFTELVNLGTITTGGDLPGPTGGITDGNGPDHRIDFASEIVHADIPAGSRLRFRWETSAESDASDYWIFGVDDVSITLAAAGDTDMNGLVDFTDYLTLSNNFGQAGDWAEGDFDGNGQVEFPDFLALSGNFGGASPAAVPEPTAASLVVLGLLGLIGFRKRR